MAQRGAERSGRPLRKTLAGLLVVAVIAAGSLVAWRTGWAEDTWRDWRDGDTAAQTDPAAVAPPADVEGAAGVEVVEPAAIAEPADADAALNRAAIAAALRPLDDRDLGRHVLAAVAPLDGTRTAYVRREGPALAIPASTTKVVTSVAALFSLGPDEVFTTSTVLAAAGRTPRVTLVGGGDPLLAAEPATVDPGTLAASTSATDMPEQADLQTLAARTARALRREGHTRVRLDYDDSLFTGPTAHPTWRADYIPDGIVSPITALWVDQGRDPSGYGRVADPSASAAQRFASALASRGIAVVGRPRAAVASADAAPLATVDSAPLSDIVRRVLEVSDNESAEVLLRHVGITQGGEGSFAAGQAGVQAILEANGIRLAGSILYDGSGLSRANRMAPELLVDVLRFAADEEQPDLWPVLAGLPVAGFTGSLTDRMDPLSGADPDGLGRVRAKTGTLTGVTSLAGTVVDADGDLMVFVLMADRVPKDRDGLARVAMDNAAAALGACACGR